jgi:uncharacterized delta-60 repeat protein
MRRAAVCVVAVLMLCLVGAGGAQARLDPSFGQGGVVQIGQQPVPSGSAGGYVRAVYLAPDGGYFVAAVRSSCPSCGQSIWISRYGADAQLQTDFGGGIGYQLPLVASEATGPAATAVDSSGRLVYAMLRSTAGSNAEELVVQRVTSAGTLDGSFGNSGSVIVSCPEKCSEVTLLAGANNSIMVAARGFGGGPRFSDPELLKPYLTLVDLNAYGLPTKRFGAPKVSRIPSRVAFQYSARTPGGGLYYGGPDSLERTSASGSKDTRFARSAATALRRLARFTGGFGIESMVVAADGKIELFGWAGAGAGFELRLRPNGKLDTGFGREGLQRFQFSVPTAVRGSGGATMVVGSPLHEVFGTIPSIYRILEDGRIDPAFGEYGEEMPGLSRNDARYEMAPAGKGRVNVFNFGGSSCRQGCPPEPRIYRFQEGK